MDLAKPWCKIDTNKRIDSHFTHQSQREQEEIFNCMKELRTAVTDGRLCSWVIFGPEIKGLSLLEELFMKLAIAKYQSPACLLSNTFHQRSPFITRWTLPIGDWFPRACDTVVSCERSRFQCKKEIVGTHNSHPSAWLGPRFLCAWLLCSYAQEACCVGWFSVKLMQARLIWEERLSIEENPPRFLPVEKSIVHFLN